VFIVSQLRRSEPRVALDVGIGNGRILEGMLAATKSTRFYGVDIADEMVAVCRERFRDEPRIGELMVCDASGLNIPIDGAFDFITAIRVITYSENWREIVSYLVSRLRPGGVFVFTMPNRNSLNRFSRAYAVPWYSTTRRELRETLEAAGTELVAVTGFVRLPHFMYDREQSPALAGLVTGTDAALGRVLGRELLVRELFVAVTKR
jgi:SAM-dependent methyltransferase